MSSKHMCGIYQMLAFQHWGGTGNTNRRLVGSSLTAKIFVITYHRHQHQYHHRHHHHHHHITTGNCRALTALPASVSQISMPSILVLFFISWSFVLFLHFTRIIILSINHLVFVILCSCHNIFRKSLSIIERQRQPPIKIRIKLFPPIGANGGWWPPVVILL